MRKLILIALIMTSSMVFADDASFCARPSAFHEGNLYAVCGIGNGIDKTEAKTKAFDSASRAFYDECKKSPSCNSHNHISEARRSICAEENSVFSCRSLFMFTVAN